MTHPLDWICHFFIGLLITWGSMVIGLNKTASALMGINTIITIEGTQIESGIYNTITTDAIIDVMFGGFGVWLATETEPFKLKFEK